MHAGNLSSDKIVQTSTHFVLVDVKWHTVQDIHYKCLSVVLLDIHVTMNWKLSKKGVCWPVSHEVHNSVRSCIFFKVIHWPVFGFQLIVSPYLVEFTLLSKCCKSWITWEGHFFLNNTSRASLWALAKSILYHHYISKLVLKMYNACLHLTNIYATPWGSILQTVILRIEMTVLQSKVLTNL